MKLEVCVVCSIWVLSQYSDEEVASCTFVLGSGINQMLFSDGIDL
jgi:hypothetical protein